MEWIFWIKRCYFFFKTKYNFIEKLWEWEKYSHMILRWKRIHKPKSRFSRFLRIFIELRVSKVQLAPQHKNFINGVANPEIDRKLIRFEWKLHGLEATIWKFFEKWILWVVSFLEVDAFLTIRILFALGFYCYILSSVYRNTKS